MSNVQIKSIGDILFLEVDQPHFFGPCSRSPNGRFTIAWSDADPSGRVGGSRKEGLGTYLLLNGSNIVLTGKMERPNDGKVSDTGIFILNDWMFGDELNGTFYAFSPSGHVLIKETFRANLYDNGLSTDGRLAACGTAGSEYKDDSNVLCIFDLESKNMVGKFVPITGHAKEYKFDGPDRTVSLVYKDNTSYRYSFNGTFLDIAQWQKERALNGSGYEILYIAEILLDNLHGSELALYSEVIDMLYRALDKGVSENTQALIHRLLGETYNRCGETTKAIDHLGNALRLNSKIGVKKLYQSLTGT